MRTVRSSLRFTARDSVMLTTAPLRSSFTLMACLLATEVALADDAADYLKQIKPLLLHKCSSCHGALQQKSGLRVDTVALLKKGGEGGAVIVPGDTVKSRLIEIVTRTGDIKMPPDGDGTPLTADEIKLLKQWIDSGAPGPADEQPQTDPRDWWSYRPVMRSAVPVVKHPEWVRTPVDAFLAAKHEKLGLTPVRETDRATWLRRVHLDLVGLPPTRDELRAFTTGTEPSDYERVVDDLLKRPQYGERWGRHWMDVWRYSDWYGSRAINEVRYSQRHIWRWRDWVVDSLNDNKPYDRMLVEMLAADEVASTDVTALPATGFIGRNWYKFDRNVWMFDLVEHTGQAFLGLTLKCCRCHDHKFDPVSQEEYFRFRAFFEPHDVRTDRLFAATGTEKDATLGDVLKDGVARVFDKQPDVKTFLFQRGDNRYPEESRPLSPGVPSALRGELATIQTVSLPVEAFYPSLRPELADGLIAQARAAVTKVEQEIVAAKEKARQIEAKLTVHAERLTCVDRQPTGERQTLVPSPPSSGERARVRGLSGDDALSKQAAEERTPHPNPLPSKARGEGTRQEANAAPFHYHDDFSQPRPNDWQPVSGEWVYENGRLIEKAVAHFATTVLNQTLPQDVRIKVKYRPLAPGQYRSIGFSFDYVDQGHSQDIYTHTGDTTQTVQAFHRVGGQQVYPQAGIVQTKDLKVGDEATIEITARGPQLTILLNGTKRLDYVMPVARRAGKFALWVHSGSAEFLELDIRELVAFPDDLRREHQVALDQVALAEQRLVTAQLEVESLRARISAERAKYAPATSSTDEPAATRKPLILAASRAEKAVAVAKADEAALQAEQYLMSVRPSLRREASLINSRRAATVVPSPPSSGERARVRAPTGDDAATKPEFEAERTPHPNPLRSKTRGEGTEPNAGAKGEEPLTLALSPQGRGEGTEPKTEDSTSVDALFYENSPAAIDAEQKLVAAKLALTAARSAMEKPDENYAVVGETFPATSTGRRTALAQWIASKQNPRTARVAVNHIWLRHFGQALVPSVANFGLNGDQPSHPELLDWLATELMDNDWKMKPLHRAIVLSAAYRMRSSAEGRAGMAERSALVPSPPSSGERARMRGLSGDGAGQPQTAEESTPHPNPLPSKARGEGTKPSEDAKRIDPTNKSLWHFPSRRMEAEVVRDSVLFAAGSLDLTRGGAEIPETLGQTSLRRSLYFRNTPNDKMKFLELFDVADPNACYRRRESVVPQQALALMNSALALDQSRLLAETLTKHVGDKDDEPTRTAFITAAFETILSHVPTDAELTASRRFLNDHSQLVATSNQAVFPAGGQSQRGPSPLPVQRARENFVHVLFSHNAFVTVR